MARRGLVDSKVRVRVGVAAHRRDRRHSCHPALAEPARSGQLCAVPEQEGRRGWLPRF
jgi:hypothetical protein